MRHYSIPLFISHLGCPHRCVFCDQHRITAVVRDQERPVRGEDVGRVVREHLETMPQEVPRVVELAFFGGTFTGLPPALQEELLQAAHALLEEGLIQHIRCSTRPDCIDEEVLRRCQKYGLDTIELGVQSLDPQVLAFSGRGHDAQSVARASRLILDFGLRLGHQIMPGLPGSNAQSDLATAKASIALNPMEARIYPTLVLAGTPLAELYRQGLYQPLDLEEALALCADMMTLYESAGVKLIRVGLQATDELSSSGSLLAGPWHPAFRELVLSLRLNRRIKAAAQSLGEAVAVWVNPRDLSVLYADGKRYFNDNAGRVSRVCQDGDLRRGQVRLTRKTGDTLGILCI